VNVDRSVQCLLRERLRGEVDVTTVACASVVWAWGAVVVVVVQLKRLFPHQLDHARHSG
jgi:hypothetical protein